MHVAHTCSVSPSAAVPLPVLCLCAETTLLLCTLLTPVWWCLTQWMLHTSSGEWTQGSCSPAGWRCLLLLAHALQLALWVARIHQVQLRFALPAAAVACPLTGSRVATLTLAA
jgi:hypothetical protein